MFKKAIPLLLMGASLGSTAHAAGDFSASDYKRALWMTTRFYGGQRSGKGPNWLIMQHKNSTFRTSFTQDADGSRDLEGGWFDCGDHVLFGQTFFYSAYMLARAYESFPTGFHDLYNGKDYSDYVAANNWDQTGGKPNGIPDLLEELKYATDWIIKATPDAGTFYFQKGNGDYDHKQWVTSGKMSTLDIEDGGEPRSVYKNPNDGPMASFAAATLAVMARIYRKYDKAYADTCLAHAKFAYAYGKSHKGATAGSAQEGRYYSKSSDQPQSVFVVSAAEMFKATKDAAYRSDAQGSAGQSEAMEWGFDYMNPAPLAPYAMFDGTGDNGQLGRLKSMVDAFAGSVGQNGADPGLCSKGNARWGALRYPANGAFAAALWSKASNASNFDQFIYDQIDYILGSNSVKRSYVIGFCAGCSSTPLHPHHRNVFLNDGNVVDASKQMLPIPERNKQFGYMVGGSWNTSTYEDVLTNARYSEGGIDYNAGLVGALGYIVSKLDPADTSKFGSVSVDGRAVRADVRLGLHREAASLVVTAPAGERLEALDVFSIDGERVFELRGNAAGSARWEIAGRSAGVYLIRARVGSDWLSARVTLRGE